MTAPPGDLEKRTHYSIAGAPDRNRYYFRRAILGLDRAINYLVSREDFDGKHLIVTGGSQGGGLSLILAGLNEHVTAAAAGVPALCDQRAELIGRSATWPRLLAYAGHRSPDWVSMSEYFDGVNFARRIKCPTVVQVGFIDNTCPATSVYAAYNVITAPKYIFNGPLSGHGGNMPGSDFVMKWQLGQLGLGPAVPLSDQTK
jgi:cephalosporin-C deacetylase-like acetyl esterase